MQQNKGMQAAKISSEKHRMVENSTGSSILFPYIV